MELLTSAQSKQIDHLASAEGLSEAQLIQNAGRRAAQIIARFYRQCRVHILCGPGNNGADGLTAAAQLQRMGFDCRLFMLGENKYQHFWKGKVYQLEGSLHHKADLIIDALFGTGLSRPLSKELLGLSSKLTADIIALDMPSGFNGDDGSGEGFNAIHTISFVRPHPGHYLYPAKANCGEVHIADIGIGDDLVADIKPDIFLNKFQPLPILEPSTNKYQRGWVLVMAGDFEKSGAANLAAISAMRIGAGLVTINTPTPNRSKEISIMAECCKLEESLKDKRRNVIVLGCGNGVNERTKANVLFALSKNIDCVLDADALTCFENDETALFKAIENKPQGAVVLTPHQGEFNRLFKFEGSRISQTIKAAKLSNAIIVLKGNDSVIANPKGKIVINNSAPAFLAKAGTGDVLAGLIGGLLAQNAFDSFAATSLACYIHGLLGEMAGTQLIATDLIDLIPELEVLNDY